MISKNRPLCICAKCPTYTSCMKENEELLFCFAGKSTCVADKKACICPSCPVTGSMGSPINRLSNNTLSTTRS